MKSLNALTHEFVEFIPDVIEEGEALRLHRVRDGGS
jgi:hypothetical protein